LSLKNDLSRFLDISSKRSRISLNHFDFHYEKKKPLFKFLREDDIILPQNLKFLYCIGHSVDVGNSAGMVTRRAVRWSCNGSGKRYWLFG
jgi:hypothetical protein